MSNSTDVYWDVNGTSLNQYAWAITTLGGSRNSLPPLRGEDATFAYLDGAAFRPKTADSRVMSLALFVIPIDPATDNYVADTRGMYTKNLHTLKKLFWTPRSQVTLTRRWQEYGSSTVLSAAAKAQATSMEPTMTGPHRADLTVDLMLADPYFYAAQQTQALSVGTPVAVTNAGDDKTTGYGCEVVFTGPLTNPQVTTTTGIWVKLGLTLAGGESATLDIYNNLATKNDGSNVIGTVAHSGARRWLEIPAGGTSLTLTASAGGGSATVKWRAPYV